MDTAVGCSKERIIYLDVLRVAACLAVISVHVSASRWRFIDVSSLEWMALNFWDSISRWGVPIFTMISGALFLDPSRRIDTKRLLSHNLARIINVFAFWSIAYVLVDLFVYQKPLSLGDIFAAIIKGPTHLWFLYMIAGLYLITPLLRKITADRDSLAFFLKVALVFSVIIPTVSRVFDALLPIVGNPRLTFIAKTVERAYENIHYHFTLEYPFYYVLGYWLHTTQVDKQKRAALYVSAILGATFIIWISRFVSLYNDKAWDLYWNLSLPNVFISSSVFVLVKTACSRVRESDAVPAKLIKFVSERSFGIYLTHLFVLVAINTHTPLNTASFYPFLAVPALVLLIFFVSLAIASLFRLIPFVGKKLM